jgi:hypothetical protein
MAFCRQLYDDAVLTNVDNLRAELGGEGVDGREVTMFQPEKLR